MKNLFETILSCYWENNITTLLYSNKSQCDFQTNGFILESFPCEKFLIISEF